MTRIFLATAIAVLAFGCATEPQPAVLTGELRGEPIALVLNGAPPLLADSWSNPENPDDIEITTDAEGRFEVELALDGPRFYRIYFGEQMAQLYLEPGDRSELVIEGESLSFGGDRAELNRFVGEVENGIRATERSISQQILALFSSEPEAFAAQIESYRAEHLAEHETFLAANPDTPPAFAERTRDDILYRFKDLELVYPTIRNEYTGELADVSERYLEEIAGDALNRPSAMSSAHYINFLDAYIGLTSAGDLKYVSRNVPREKLLSRYETIAALDFDPSIERYLLSEMFRNFQISYGPRDWGRVLKRLEADDPDNPIAAKVRPDFEEGMARREAPDEIRIYKTIDGAELEAHLFYPDDLAPDDRRSAYLFFHGGGWAIGTPEWGYRNCERMAAQGMVAVSFEYRLADVHGTGIFTAVEDVQSAIRWARSELPIDSDRVVAAGFSAGGHLAGTTAILDIIGPDEPSPRPNALVIHSSSYNLTKSRFFDAMTEGRAQEVSLTHQVEAGLVPAILFHGRYDHLAPLAEFEEFVARMKALDNDFEHHLFDVGHFFRNDEASRRVHELTDAFLVERGFLPER